MIRHHDLTCISYPSMVSGTHACGGAHARGGAPCTVAPNAHAYSSLQYCVTVLHRVDLNTPCMLLHGTRTRVLSTYTSHACPGSRPCDYNQKTQKIRIYNTSHTPGTVVTVEVPKAQSCIACKTSTHSNGTTAPSRHLSQHTSQYSCSNDETQATTPNQSTTHKLL